MLWLVLLRSFIRVQKTTVSHVDLGWVVLGWFRSGYVRLG